ncbi:MAG: hypothetical protein NC250_01185 [Alistipes senegalensis]|nr:hypothetical protein [Bacteroides cellulosilyticus]MCM1351332.1 hypothetical protein [Alistipes senegalensis]
MAIYNGDKLVKKLYVGGKRVRAVYAGAEKVWLDIVRMEHGEEYGEWTYDDPVRRRTVTSWEQDVYEDGSLGERRIGTPYTQEETAAATDEWDGVTYWNGSCGIDYCYVDYKKVRTCYTYPDIVRYSGWWNGEVRKRRIEGQCGWERNEQTTDWVDTGVLCDKDGTWDKYNCNGTYSVYYHLMRREVYKVFPDGSDYELIRYEHKAGEEAKCEQINGQCGFTQSSYINIYIDDPRLSVSCYLSKVYIELLDTTSNQTNNFNLDLGVGNTSGYSWRFEIPNGHKIVSARVELTNSKTYQNNVQVSVFFKGNQISIPVQHALAAGASLPFWFSLNISANDGYEESLIFRASNY